MSENTKEKQTMIKVADEIAKMQDKAGELVKLTNELQTWYKNKRKCKKFKSQINF